MRTKTGTARDISENRCRDFDIMQIFHEDIDRCGGSRPTFEHGMTIHKAGMTSEEAELEWAISQERLEQEDSY